MLSLRLKAACDTPLISLHSNRRQLLLHRCVINRIAASRRQQQQRANGSGSGGNAQLSKHSSMALEPQQLWQRVEEVYERAQQVGGGRRLGLTSDLWPAAASAAAHQTH